MNPAMSSDKMGHNVVGSHAAGSIRAQAMADLPGTIEVTDQRIQEELVTYLDRTWNFPILLSSFSFVVVFLQS